ncbi:MAG TPA: Hpt domain-containing protein [Casimicrobiaceae bacterium]|jgi:HPt (histidine-containing phosphotransfer) domain-containing protein
MSDGPVDRTTYDALAQSTGADFARELAGTFLADAPTMLAALRAAFERADAVAFRRTAHSLKSNAQTFGAFALGARARALETTGLDAIRAAGGAPLDDLESEYARVAAALGELARG